jgi:hypothetical protein
MNSFQQIERDIRHTVGGDARHAAVVNRAFSKQAGRTVNGLSDDAAEAGGPSSTWS